VLFQELRNSKIFYFAKKKELKFIEDKTMGLLNCIADV
jgi:hypothetical protein